jgi:hypothetical protein
LPRPSGLPGNGLCPLHTIEGSFPKGAIQCQSHWLARNARGYLRLEAGPGNVQAQNDDISNDNLNSWILFTPKEDGRYRLIAKSFEHRGSGAYTLSIREFAREDEVAPRLQRQEEWTHSC